jgi:ribosomal protein L27
MGQDHTLFAMQDGIVAFRKKKVKSIGIKLKDAVLVDVVKR